MIDENHVNNVVDTIQPTKDDESITIAWEKWSANALHPNTPINQRVSMKAAFLCGASCMLKIIVDSQDQPEALMQSALELETFGSTLTGKQEHFNG
jgi:hypothetical protein